MQVSYSRVIENTVKTANFPATNGTETFFALEAPTGLDFSQSLDYLLGEYHELLTDQNLGMDTEVFLRFHVSDIANQQNHLKRVLQKQGKQSQVSIIGQPPASQSKIAFEAYHIKSETPIQKQRIQDKSLLVRHGEYQSLWSGCRPSSIGPAYQQTQQLFGQLSHALRGNGATLEENVIRTWLYVRDVDNNYQGMVDARRELFELVGMNKATHYIASTGIEGCGENVSDLVIMDVLSVMGLDASQIVYMSAPSYLCPTYEYNVTFERATQVIYGDRSHYYISGTASIDHEGNILHVGNVEKQAHRTIMNIQALLNSYGANLNDLKILVVYLRDISDFAKVTSFLKENLPENLPYVMVRGSVCRPLWLIEMEGIAISPYSNMEFNPFC
jgi:enamine deaminase RidA (YjgF/YER057c/UK114 family)